MIRLEVLIYCSFLINLGILANFGIADDEEKPVSVHDRFRLHSGDLMPYVGFGTFKVVGDDYLLKVLDLAFASGYRLIDTAQAYKNEESIGKALKVLLPKYNLTRKDVFITSKLLPDSIGADDIYTSIDQSIKKLDSQYLDLFLIHFPGIYRRDEKPNPKNDSVLRDETWQVFVRAVKAGLLRNIGVSNYNVRHMKELIKNDHGIKPALNQVEWHPAYHQPELLELCRKEGVLLQAYGSLGGTGTTEYLFTRPEVVKIAEKLKKTPAQVLLRWALQQKIGIIPKASSEKHVKENMDLDFTIPEEDMKVLLNFEQKQFAWDPTSIQ